MNLYIPNPKTNILLAPRPLAVGGEGELYNLLSYWSVSGAELPNFANLVAKVLLPNKRNLDKRRKIEYLIANAPDNQANAHADVIWAKFVLENEQGEFMGYLMDKAEGEKLELLCTNKIPVPFQQKWGRFSLDLPESRLLRLKICYNLCVAVEKMHRKGYVLVDLKPENVMIQPDGRVSVIDTDSVQVVENQKLLYPANVSTPEYTPAENYHIAHTPIDKRIISKTWDEFSIAVIQYRILFGIHPFTATSAGRYEHCTDLQQKIQCGLFVHSPNHQAFISKKPAPHAAYTSCPAALKDYFCASLSDTPAVRQPLLVWIPILQSIITNRPINQVPTPIPPLPPTPPPATVPNNSFQKRILDFLLGGAVVSSLIVIGMRYSGSSNSQNISNNAADTLSNSNPSVPVVDTNLILYPLEKNGKWGFVDIKGNEIIPFMYDYASIFREGLAEVKNNNKSGFVNTKGNEIIPCIYDDAFIFSEGLAGVKRNGKWSFIDKNGNEIIPFIYDAYFIFFKEGLAAVEKNGKSGFIDKNGKEVIPFIYDNALSFSEGLASVRKNGKSGFIDKNGNEVIPFIYDSAWGFSEGLSHVQKNGKGCFIDKKGNEIIPFIDDAYGAFSEGLALVQKNGKGCFIDKKGNEVISFIYDNALSFSEGLANVQKNWKFGYIDKKGNEIIPFIYDAARSFDEGLAFVEKDGKQFYIDKTGKCVLGCE